MKKLLRNSAGFSLLETVIVLGIMAASATYFMSMQQNIIKSQTRFESINESEIMLQVLELGLIKKESCTQTIQTAPQNGKIETGAELQQVVSVLPDGSTRQIYQKVQDGFDFSEFVNIEKIEIGDVTPITPTSGTFNLNISYKRKKAILKDDKVYVKTTSPIKYKSIANNVIEECISTGGGAVDVDEIVDTVKEELCLEDGGQFDPQTKECTKPDGGLELSEEVSLKGDNKASQVLGSTEEYELCFVTGFQLETLKKGSNPDFGCRVYKSAGNWILDIPSAFRTRGESFCKAQCMNVCNGPRDGYWKLTSSSSCQQDPSDKKYYVTYSYQKVEPKCGSKKTKPMGPQRVPCQAPPKCASGNINCPAAYNQCMTPQQCVDAGGDPSKFQNFK